MSLINLKIVSWSFMDNKNVDICQTQEFGNCTKVTIKKNV